LLLANAKAPTNADATRLFLILTDIVPNQLSNVTFII